jgi:hypothetical protein
VALLAGAAAGTSEAEQVDTPRTERGKGILGPTGQNRSSLATTDHEEELASLG